MKSTRAFAFLCDRSAKLITSVITGAHPLPLSVEEPDFVALVDPDSRQKLGQMLDTARLTGSAVGWQLELVVENRLESVECAAIWDESRFLIVGARLRDDSLALMQDLRERDELSPVMSSRLKEATESLSGMLQSESEMYDEMTGLYNDMSSLQREVAKKNSQLEALNKLKNQFVGMAAHDLRNPLSNIINLAEFLLRDDQITPEEREEFAVTIRRLSGSMLNLVEDLLDLTSIESGLVTLRVETVDLVDLARKCAAQLGALARPIEVEVRLTSDLERLEIRIDREKIAQVFDNLVDNAMSHSPAGSVVEIRVSSVDRGTAQVTIADSGEGIPKSQMESLFEPFHGGASSGRRHKSRGLGLAIVKRLVESHGGTISVTSTPGRGTKFTFTIPNQQENETFDGN